MKSIIRNTFTVIVAFAILFVTSCEKEAFTTDLTQQSVENTVVPTLSEEEYQKIVENLRARAYADFEKMKNGEEVELRSCSVTFTGDDACDDASSMVTSFLSSTGCTSQYFTPGTASGNFVFLPYAPNTVTYYVDGDDDINADTNIEPDLISAIQQRASNFASTTGNNPTAVYGQVAGSWPCVSRSNNSALIVLAAVGFDNN